VLAGVDDTTIATAIRGVKDPERRGIGLPPDGKLTLAWPVPDGVFAGATEDDPSARH